ncbi:hypothetical protein P308_05660 [Pseudomonas piscis]|nr:hypothetical protein P308_05660 [Pseudomonas piscis]
MALESESPQLYRAEYLAGQVLDAADRGQEGLSLENLKPLLAHPEELARVIRDFAAPRYKEGYEKGIHDHDAAAILLQLLPLRDSAGLLAYGPAARAFAALYWDRQQAEPQPRQWVERARTSRHIQQLFGRREGLLQLQAEILVALEGWHRMQGFAVATELLPEAAEYLVQELAADRVEFTFSKYARQLQEALALRLQGARMWDDYQQALARLAERPAAQWALTGNWLAALCAEGEFAPLAGYVPRPWRCRCWAKAAPDGSPRSTCVSPWTT